MDGADPGASVMNASGPLVLRDERRIAHPRRTSGVRHRVVTRRGAHALQRLEEQVLLSARQLPDIGAVIRQHHVRDRAGDEDADRGADDGEP
jgi:hypothetical protein